MAKAKKAEQKKQEEQVQETPAVVEETVEQEATEVAEAKPTEEKQEEQTEEFSASKFMSYDKDTVEELKEEAETDVKATEQEEPVQETEEDGSLSWDDVKTDEVKEEQPQEEDKNPWDDIDNNLGSETQEKEEVEQTEEPKAESDVKEETPESLDWKKVSDELGVKAESKEELLDHLNSDVKQAEYNNSVIDQLQDFLKLADRDLIHKELTMQGQMEDYEINENLDKLEDSGMLKYQANALRGSVRSAIRHEQEKEKNVQSQEQQERTTKIEESRNNLKGFLKESTMFFGGKVSETERMNVYKDICNGKLETLLYKNPETTSKVMWMLRNPDKLEKVLYGRGLEAGKAQVLNNITTPDLGRRNKTNYKIKDSSEFDAQQFMKK